MGRVIKIDWNSTKELGDIFKIDAEDLMTILDDTESIVESIRDCWHGKDTENFIINSKTLLDEIKKEPGYLIDWYEFFTKATYRYSDNVETGLNKVRSVNAVFADEYEREKHNMGA